MAKIYGNIATINNNHTIKVSIYNKNLSAPDINIDASHTVKFSAEPVEITQQQDNTFEHILKTQCKIRLVTKEWLGDYLFAANYSSIVVNVWVDNHCVFCGYVTPHTYNQSYAHQWEEVEINCVDILSTLKDRRLTDNTTYEELVAQSTTRPFSWFLGNMDLDTTTVVIPNFPDIDYQEAEMAWYEVSWTRVVNQDDSIDYYGIEAEVVLLDDDTAMNTGNERQGELKTVTWIESTDTCIVDGVSYYKEYAHITVAGEDVNTGDWRIGSNAGGMPQVVSTENRIDGWTTGVLPQPFDFWEHYTTYNIYDNGMEIAASDGIGEQIPESPNTTTAGSYYEFRQGSRDDVDIDEDTGYIYYKDYAWVCVNNECTNSGQWQRGNEIAHPTGTHTVITGWQYDTPPVAFEYYETVAHYIDYSDGSEVFDYDTMGSQIPLTPNTTTAGSYYEYRQGDENDLDIDSVTGYYYYKDYAWVTVNGVSEKTTNWRRGARYIDYSIEYLTIEATSNGNVTIDISDSLNTNYLTSFSYSTDHTNWTTWTNDNQGTTITVALNTGDKLHLKGEGTSYRYAAYDTATIFTITCNANVYGNIMSLLYGDNFANASILYDNSFIRLFKDCTTIDIQNLRLPATSLGRNCYFEMFRGCTSLTTVPTLPATTLTDNCYGGMFEGCTSLTTVPTLPATTLAYQCYYHMFYGCTALTTAPTIYATTLAPWCCYSMFYGCTALTTAPTISAATTFAQYCCYEMFYGCTSLTTAPSISATTLVDHCCYEMFYGCTSLTTAPSISATVFEQYACYRMFRGCTSLTTAPSIYATTLGDYCCFAMFDGCTSLTTAPSTLPATTLADYCYQAMFYGCTSLTTAPTISATTLASSCCKGMFDGCTSLTTAPALPATTLASQCYYGMFQGCTALTTAPTISATTTEPMCCERMFYGCSRLTTAPTLPATTLDTRCYYEMFYGCSRLSSITMLATNIIYSDCLLDWVNGVASSGTFTKAASMSTLPSGDDGIPSGWTVIDA